MAAQFTRRVNHQLAQVRELLALCEAQNKAGEPPVSYQALFDATLTALEYAIACFFAEVAAHQNPRRSRVIPLVGIEQLMQSDAAELDQAASALLTQWQDLYRQKGSWLSELAHSVSTLRQVSKSTDPEFNHPLFDSDIQVESSKPSAGVIALVSLEDEPAGVEDLARWLKCCSLLIVEQRGQLQEF